MGSSDALGRGVVAISSGTGIRKKAFKLIFSRAKGGPMRACRLDKACPEAHCAQEIYYFEDS